jgi:hypothetical protein
MCAAVVGGFFFLISFEELGVCFPTHTCSANLMLKKGFFVFENRYV